VSDLVSAHSDAPAYLRRGRVSAAQLRLRPGFFRARGDRGGKRVSGVDFKITFAGRRAGDPAQIVAASDRVRSLLKWQPHFDDLQTIVSHALAWERKLFDARRLTSANSSIPLLRRSSRVLLRIRVPVGGRHRRVQRHSRRREPYSSYGAYDRP
jgi:hypothetical protein